MPTVLHRCAGYCGEFRSGGSTAAGSFGPFGEPETDPIGNPIDPTRQYPADLAPSSIPVNAYHFIADRIQEASDLAHNNAQYAAAVNPVLSDLLGIDSAASYAQIRTLYPRALPSLLSPNRDDSFTLNIQNLMSQYQSLASGAQAVLDADLALLASPSSGSSELQIRLFRVGPDR